MSGFCTVRRWDVDPTCDPFSSQYAPHVCSHAVCLEDIRLHQQGYQHARSDWDCPAGQCELARNKAYCDLDAGHEGAHQWQDTGGMALGEWTLLPTPEAADARAV